MIDETDVLERAERELRRRAATVDQTVAAASGAPVEYRQRGKAIGYRRAADVVREIREDGR